MTIDLMRIFPRKAWRTPHLYAKSMYGWIVEGLEKDLDSLPTDPFEDLT